MMSENKMLAQVGKFLSLEMQCIGICKCLGYQVQIFGKFASIIL